MTYSSYCYTSIFEVWLSVVDNEIYATWTSFEACWFIEIDIHVQLGAMDVDAKPGKEHRCFSKEASK